MEVGPTQLDGYCSKCPQETKLRQWSTVQKWSNHVKYNQHKVEHVQHICNFCEYKANRKEKLEEHMCFHVERTIQTAVNVHQYRLLPQDSHWMQDLANKEPEDLVEIAIEQKVIVPGRPGNGVSKPSFDVLI